MESNFGQLVEVKYNDLITVANNSSYSSMPRTAARGASKPSSLSKFAVTAYNRPLASIRAC